MAGHAQELTIAMTGDVMMGTTFPSIMLPANDGRNLFKDAKEILTRTDLTLGNLEGAICDGGKSTKGNGPNSPRSELAGLQPPYDGDRRMMWLIPGLGFDMKGHRLGRGGGYYDRLLCGATGMKTGIGYDCQIFDAIPCEPHDIEVD